MLTMLNSGKINQLKTLVILLTLNLTFQLCQKQMNKTCFQCSNGFHLYRTNCIYDITNCNSYTKGFKCSKCEENYFLAYDFGSCKMLDHDDLPIPQYGFKVYPLNRYYQQPFASLLKDSKKRHIDIYAVLYQDLSAYFIFRIVFLIDEGFIQNTYTVLKENNKTKLQESLSFSKKPDQEFAQIQKQKIYDQLKQYLISNFNFPSIVEAYKKAINNTIVQYHFILLENNSHLVETELIVKNAQKVQKVEQLHTGLSFIEYDIAQAIHNFQLAHEEIAKAEIVRVIERKTMKERQYQVNFIFEKRKFILKFLIVENKVIFISLDIPYEQVIGNELESQEVKAVVQRMKRYFSKFKIKNYILEKVEKSTKNENEFLITYKINIFFITYRVKGERVLQFYKKENVPIKFMVEFIQNAQFRQNRLSERKGRQIKFVQQGENLEKIIVESQFEDEKVQFSIIYQISNKQIVNIRQKHNIKQKVVKRKSISKEQFKKSFFFLLSELIIFDENFNSIHQIYRENGINIETKKGILFKFGEQGLPSILPLQNKDNVFQPVVDVVRAKIKQVFRFETDPKIQFVQSSNKVWFINYLVYRAYLTKDQTYIVEFIIYTNTSELFTISASKQTKIPSSYSNKVKTTQRMKDMMKQIYGPKISVKYQQQNTEDFEIYSVMLHLYKNNKIQRILSIFKINQKAQDNSPQLDEILRQTYISEGFSDADLSSQTMKEMNDFILSILKQYPLGQKVSILSAKIREAQNKGEFKVFYEFENHTILVIATFDGKQRSIIHLQTYQTKLKQQRQIYNMNSQMSKTQLTSEIQFKKSQNVLFEEHQYLSSFMIISVEAQDIFDLRKYTVFYQNKGRYYQVILVYDYQEEQGKVISFLNVNAFQVPVSLNHCREHQNAECLKCEEGYFLGRDRKCFKSINGCLIQSGELCIRCEFEQKQIVSIECDTIQ